MKALYRHWIYVLSLVVCTLSAQAQEATLSLYEYSPLFSNPAMLGVMRHPAVSISHRQYSVEAGTQASTSSVSGYYPIALGRHRLGLATSIVSDRQTDFLTTQGQIVGIGYGIQIAPRHALSLGMQAGIFNRSLSSFSYTTAQQFTGGVFLPDAPTGEVLPSGSRSFLNLSTGLYWQMKDRHGRGGAYAGAALFNYNKPEVGLNTDYQLPHTFKGIAGWHIHTGGALSVEPNIRWLYGGGLNQFQGGTWLRYALDAGLTSPQELSLGLWYKSTEASVLALTYQTKKVTAGLSYDMPMASELHSFRQGGIFELMISLRFGRARTFTRRTKSPAATSDDDEAGKAEVSTVPTALRSQAVAEEAFEKPEPWRTHTVQSVPLAEASQPRALSPEEQALLARVVRFEFGGAKLDAESEAFLEEVAAVLKQKPWLQVTLTGHSCSIGDAAVNQRISEQRASIVEDYLTRKGVGQDQIEVIGMGEAEPLTTNATEEGRVQNRRVAFQVKE